MSWTDSPGPKPHRSQEELLALVYLKASARSGATRLERVLAVAVASVLVVGLLTVIHRDGHGDDRVVRTDGGHGVAASRSSSGDAGELAPSVTSGSPRDLPASPHSPLPTTPGFAARQPPPDEPAPDSPAETTPPGSADAGCRDSYDPACGPLTWDPPPGINQPLTVAVTASPSMPVAGQTVTFHVVVDDPDAPISDCISAQEFGDGPGVVCTESMISGYGAWTPIAQAGHVERDFVHVYSAPGTYVVEFGFVSGDSNANFPYRSQGEGTATVVVTG